MAKKSDTTKTSGTNGSVRPLMLELVGTRKLVMHNSRLANPLDSYTQAIGAVAKKRNKTLDDYRELAQLEMRGGMYEAPGDLIGIPMENIWRAIHGGATAYKLGNDVKRALRYEPVVIPIYLDGDETVLCDEYMQRPESLHYTSVGIAGRRAMRARPQVAAGWALRPTFDLDESVLPLTRLLPALDRAGSYVGLCERRPLFGTFTVKVLEG